MNSSSEDDDGGKDPTQYDLTEAERISKKQLQDLKSAISFQNEDSPKASSPSSKSSRILSLVKRHIRAETALLKEISDLKKQLNDQQVFLSEVTMERDALLQQLYTYLELNSSLRVRLEEQRCQTGSLQGKMNADMESRIKSLESDKEKLSDLNLEKENELREMKLLLEQTVNCLRNKEAEETIQKKEENNVITALKSGLKSALEEKTKLEEKYLGFQDRVEDYFTGKNAEGLMKKANSLRRSLSMGDINWKNLFLERNTALEPPEIQCQNVGKNFQKTPRAYAKHWTVQELPKTPPVHAQLKALKGDLLKVTRKLESLKCQLVSSGIVKEEPKQADIRRLKRKAKPIEDQDESVAEEFKNLKNIFQDARNLNVKLQNLTEEKQRIVDLNKKEAGVQVTEKCEGRHRHFQRAVMKLKKAVSECEEKLEGGVVTEAEALAGLVSPFYACILSNSRCFHECRKRTGSEFNDETDTDSLMDDGSTEASSLGEDGGGDNLLKKQISNRGSDCGELKSSKLNGKKHEIENPAAELKEQMLNNEKKGRPAAIASLTYFPGAPFLMENDDNQFEMQITEEDLLEPSPSNPLTLRKDHTSIAEFKRPNRPFHKTQLLVSESLKPTAFDIVRRRQTCEY